MKRTIKAAAFQLAASSLPLLLNPSNVGRAVESLGALPNVPLRVMRRGVFWRTVAHHDGWAVERNVFTGHCRLVDPDNVRQSWGSESAMRELLGQLVNGIESQR